MLEKLIFRYKSVNHIELSIQMRPTFGITKDGELGKGKGRQTFLKPPMNIHRVNFMYFFILISQKFLYFT